MDKRNAGPIVLAVVAAATLAATLLVTPSAAIAGCPQDHIEPVDVEISKEPASDLMCVAVSVQGRWRGCQRPSVEFENDCSRELAIADESLQCRDGDEQNECDVIPEGVVGVAELRGDAPADGGDKRTHTYEGQLGEQEIGIQVEYRRKWHSRGGSGCVESDSARAAPAGALVFVVPFLLLRLRNSRVSTEG